MIGSLPPEQWAGVLRWLGWLSLATVLSRPLSRRFLPDEGGGWIAAKLLAWLIVGYVPWCLASFGILDFNTSAMVGVLVLSLLALRNGLGPGDLRGLILTEASFLIVFWFGLAARLAHPDLIGLEKFTNMGFLSASMRSATMPPQDAWYAGYTINYYYVGQAMAAAWGNLAEVSADHAYQLSMATIFALTALGTFHIITGIARHWGQRLGTVLGVFGASLIVYGGNGHSVLYSLFRPWMPTTKADFYYPDSTRFIGFDPDTLDKAFTEFFAYGIAAGDLHAHILATPLFLLAVATILCILGRGLSGIAPSLVQSVALGWFLGLSYMVNSWDFAILGLIASVALTILLLRSPTGSHLTRKEMADRLGASAIVALSVAALTTAPFAASFQPFANGIAPVLARTPIWQLLVIYAHVVPSLVALGLLLTRRGDRSPYMPAIALAATGLILVGIPEVIFLRDIYGADYARANTMFKLTFRAQALLVMASVAVLAPALRQQKAVWTAIALLCMVPLGLTLNYAGNVFHSPAKIRSLDGLAFLGAERDLVAAAGSLTIPPGESFVEATGLAFTDTSRVSALTGQPAVIGWAGHEWLWRNDVGSAYDRANDIDRFYTTQDQLERCRIIKRYNIRFVVIGTIEKRQYPGLNEIGLSRLGPAVFSDASGIIRRVPNETCPR